MELNPLTTFYLTSFESNTSSVVPWGKYAENGDPNKNF
jgi:hypothetical protein